MNNQLGIEPKSKITIGVLLYHSQKYLPDCLSTLLAQDYPATEIMLLDNSNGESGDFDWIKKHHPDLAIFKAPNLGFGGGHNLLMEKAKGDFYACLNVDMRFEKNFLTELMKTMEKDPKNAIVTGKLKRWDFENREKNEGKTGWIDTVGLRFFRSHRFVDEGQGVLDEGQYDHECEIFGSSGAAFLGRMEAFLDVAFTNAKGGKEVFDELMFMYKEDIDLMVRLRWAGWKAWMTPRAVAYHDRTVHNAGGSGACSILKNRRNKSQQVNSWSYLNHQIMLRKNKGDFSWRTRWATAVYQFKTHLYISLFERYLLKNRKCLQELQSAIQARRNVMKRRVSVAEIEKWMQ